MLLALAFGFTMVTNGAWAEGISSITVNKGFHSSPHMQSNNIGNSRRRKNKISPNNLHLLDIRGGSSRSATIAESEPASSNDDPKTSTLNALHQTSFLIVASMAMVMFSPLPSLTRSLAKSNLEPQAKAVQILALLTAISAAIELFLSPLVGVLIDSFGRKLPSVVLYGLIAIANLAVVCKPGVWSVCASRMVNTVVGGFLVIVSNSMIADVFSSSLSSRGNELMGSTLGRQAACVATGFLCGAVAGGQLTTKHGERAAYGSALAFSVLAMLNAAFRMFDTLELTRDASAEPSIAEALLPAAEKVSVAITLRNKFLEAPLSAIQLLFHYGSQMRTLALLLVLQTFPGFMGDVFQIFAKEEWNLLPKDFANMIAVFGVLGIISNITLPPILQRFGLRNFTLFAIVSSLLIPVTTVLGLPYKYILMGACVGLYGGAQRIGTSAAMTNLATELGIPQGQLQGEKASMLALLKIGSPILYSMLYLKGRSWSSAGDGHAASVLGLEMVKAKLGSKLPFVLNVILGICAFAVTWQNI